MNSEVEKKLRLINAQVVLWGLLFSIAIYRFEETIGFGLVISNVSKVILSFVLILSLIFVRKSMRSNSLKDNNSDKKKPSQKNGILTIILISAVIAFFAIKVYTQN